MASVELVGLVTGSWKQPEASTWGPWKVRACAPGEKRNPWGGVRLSRGLTSWCSFLAAGDKSEDGRKAEERGKVVSKAPTGGV